MKISGGIQVLLFVLISPLSGKLLMGQGAPSLSGDASPLLARLASVMESVDVCYYKWASYPDGKPYGLTLDRFRKRGYRYQVESRHSKETFSVVEDAFRVIPTEEGVPRSTQLRDLLVRLCDSSRSGTLAGSEPFFASKCDGVRMTAWTNYGKGFWTGKYSMKHEYSNMIPNLFTVFGNTGVGADDAYDGWVWQPEVQRTIETQATGARSVRIVQKLTGSTGSLMREIAYQFGNGISAEECHWSFKSEASVESKYIAERLASTPRPGSLEPGILVTVRQISEAPVHSEYYAVVFVQELSISDSGSMDNMDVRRPPEGYLDMHVEFFDEMALQGPTEGGSGSSQASDVSRSDEGVTKSLFGVAFSIIAGMLLIGCGLRLLQPKIWRRNAVQ